MLCALGEFGLAHGIKSFLMVTNLSLIRSMILKSGCVTEILGRPQRLGRFPVVAARIPVVADGLAKLRRYHGVDTPILNVVSGPLACVG
jgi:N-acyl-L-homoserine lactone synthetase